MNIFGVHVPFTARAIPETRDISKCDKETITEGYEENRGYFRSGLYSTLNRNDKVYNYKDYKHAYSNHPTFFAVVNALCKGTFGNGYEIVPVPGMKNPKESNKLWLEDYFKNVNPIFTMTDTMYSAGADFFYNGTKIIEIDQGNSCLYSDVDFGTLKPIINKKGEFVNKDAAWMQIIDSSPVTKLGKDQVLWLRMLDRDKMIFPTPPAKPLMDYIEMSILSRLMEKEKLQNTEMFGATFELPERSTEAQATKLRDFLNKNYSLEALGYAKAKFKRMFATALVLFGGAKRNSAVSEAMSKMDSIEREKFVDSRIFMVYNVSPRSFGEETAGLGQSGANDSGDKQTAKVSNYWQRITEAQIQKQLVQNVLYKTTPADWMFKWVRNVVISPREELNAEIDILSRLLYDDIIDREEYRERAGKLEAAQWLSEKKIPKKTIVPERSTNIPHDCTSTSRKIDVPLIRWNMRMVKSDLDEGDEKIDTVVFGVLDRMFEDAKKSARKASDAGDIGFTFKLKYKSELSDKMRKTSIELFDDGRKDIRRQLSHTRSMNIRLSVDTVAQYKKLVKKESDNASQSISEEMTTQMNIVYNNAITQKWSTNELIGKMQESFDKLRNKFPATTQTIVTSFYNYGRQQSIYDAGYDLVPKAQVNAVLDGHTTDRCRRLNGAIVDVDSDLYERVLGPLHYRCRTTIIPITKYDIEEKAEYGIDTNRKEIDRIFANTPGFTRHSEMIRDNIRSCFEGVISA